MLADWTTGRGSNPSAPVAADCLPGFQSPVPVFWKQAAQILIEILIGKLDGRRENIRLLLYYNLLLFLHSNLVRILSKFKLWLIYDIDAGR